MTFLFVSAHFGARFRRSKLPQTPFTSKRVGKFSVSKSRTKASGNKKKCQFRIPQFQLQLPLPWRTRKLWTPIRRFCHSFRLVPSTNSQPLLHILLSCCVPSHSCLSNVSIFTLSFLKYHFHISKTPFEDITFTISTFENKVIDYILCELPPFLNNSRSNKSPRTANSAANIARAATRPGKFRRFSTLPPLFPETSTTSQNPPWTMTTSEDGNCDANIANLATRNMDGARKMPKTSKNPKPNQQTIKWAFFL